MKKIDIVREVYRRTGKYEPHVVSAVFDTITDMLQKGEKVSVSGFGVFETKTRAPRIGRNINKGIPVPIPPRIVPVFTPGKEMKSAFDQMPGKKEKK